MYTLHLYNPLEGNYEQRKDMASGQGKAKEEILCCRDHRLRVEDGRRMQTQILSVIRSQDEAEKDAELETGTGSVPEGVGDSGFSLYPVSRGT